MQAINSGADLASGRGGLSDVELRRNEDFQRKAISNFHKHSDGPEIGSSPKSARLEKILISPLRINWRTAEVMQRRRFERPRYEI